MGWMSEEVGIAVQCAVQCGASQQCINYYYSPMTLITSASKLQTPYGREEIAMPHTDRKPCTIALSSLHILSIRGASITNLRYTTTCAWHSRHAPCVALQMSMPVVHWSRRYCTPSLSCLSGSFLCEGRHRVSLVGGGGVYLQLFAWDVGVSIC